MTSHSIRVGGMVFMSALLSSAAFGQDDYSIQFVPQTFRSISETVVVSAPDEVSAIIPAEFGTITEDVVTVEAHCPGDELVPKPITIETEPSYIFLRSVPAQYKTVYEQVVEREGFSEWRPTADGGVEFFSTEPDVRTVAKRVRSQAQTVQRVSVPGRTVTYMSRGRPSGAGALTCFDKVPAQTRQVSRRVVITPAREATTAIPARTATITRRVTNPQTIRLVPPPGASGRSFDATSVMPTNPEPGTLYKPEVRNEKCVLWKSFTKDDADTQKGRFPWPPPVPTTESTMPEDMFAGVTTLGEMNKRLSNALDAMGYQDRRRKYYAVPHGFALVTEIEQIDDNGLPLSDGARWTDDIYVIDPPSIFGWLKALVTKASGRFRVFALVVTSEDVNAEGQFKDREIALDWLNSGTGALNRDRAACPFSAAHRVTALVYEFEHPERQDPFLVARTPINHIASSGLRRQLAKAGATR